MWIQQFSYLEQCSAGLTILCGIFITFGLNDKILLVQQNIVMDVNNVMGRLGVMM